MYTYIYIYILNYYLPAFTVTRKKKKKTPEFRDNNILTHCIGEKEKKNSFGKKINKRPTSSHQLKKNQVICNPLVKRTKTHRKMLQCYNYK